MTLVRFFVALIVLPSFFLPALFAETWEIPMAGNSYQVEPGPGKILLRNGALSSAATDRVNAVFFRVNRAAKLKLSLQGSSSVKEPSTWKVEVGDQSFTATLPARLDHPVELGEVNVGQAGYVKITFSTPEKPLQAGQLHSLRVESKDEGLKLDYVRDNQNRMFYWGRRGPSVHLRYQLPNDGKIEWAYAEVTVPPGQDPIGSYFMAIGFQRGYFGIQVNSPQERRVLFSVWSPYSTDHPQEVPEDQRVKTLARGSGVHAQDFGNEGSGGQSFFRYAWKTETTYRFLVRVRPNKDNSTTYTAWFSPKEGKDSEWHLIASFRRPQTNIWLRGYYSFLENFSPDYGAVTRSARYHNQWVCDSDGNWHEVTRARFTADPTARKRYRLDYAGGLQGDGFFLKNCGFFSDKVPIDSVFERPSKPESKPQIDFEKLPRE